MERREFLRKAGVAIAILLIDPSILEDSLAAEEEAIRIPFKKIYEELTRGKKVIEGRIKLKVPKIAEDGAVVPIEIEVDFPMEKDNYIQKIHVLPTKNRVNKVITAHYTPDNGIAYLYVNAKLAESQDIVVLAETNGGTIFKTSRFVKVLISGCGDME